MNTRVYSDEDFKGFEGAVWFWASRLGVTGWLIDVKHRLLDNAKARTYIDATARTACICLTTTHNYDYNDGMTLNELALHEVLHIMLTDFSLTVEKLGDADHDLVISKEHDIIHRLVEALNIYGSKHELQS